MHIVQDREPDGNRERRTYWALARWITDERAAAKHESQVYPDGKGRGVPESEALSAGSPTSRRSFFQIIPYRFCAGIPRSVFIPG